MHLLKYIKHVLKFYDFIKDKMRKQPNHKELHLINWMNNETLKGHEVNYFDFLTSLIRQNTPFDISEDM